MLTIPAVVCRSFRFAWTFTSVLTSFIEISTSLPNTSLTFRALDQRYEAAVEVRNNLVAASQNIQGAQRYLNSVQFPYCAPSEVDTLNKVGGFDIRINFPCLISYIT